MDRRGTPARHADPGRIADLTLWGQDPAELPSEVRDLNPTYTLFGGRMVHSPGLVG